MLSDHELQALREIERRLRWTSPELIRLFDGMDPPSEENRRKRARVRALLAAFAVAGLTLRGPRMLNEAETTAQQASATAAKHRHRRPPSPAGVQPCRSPLPRSRLPSPSPICLSVR